MPKQKKQQSKFKKFISWFKPTSVTKGALLFAIAFAVIGGSYMAYKSFASTDWFIAFPPKDVKCSGNCDQLWDKWAKHPTNAARVNDWNPLSHAYTEFNLLNPWNKFPSYTSIKTYACAWVRTNQSSESGIVTAEFEVLDVPDIYIYAEKYIPGSDIYQELCTPYVNVPGGQHVARFTIRSGNNLSRVFVSRTVLKTL